MIIEGFPYIILFNFGPNAKNAKFNSTPNLVDLQYPQEVHHLLVIESMACIYMDRELLP